jgi:hypothetical protein
VLKSANVHNRVNTEKPSTNLPVSYVISAIQGICYNFCSFSISLCKHLGSVSNQKITICHYIIHFMTPRVKLARLFDVLPVEARKAIEPS